GGGRRLVRGADLVRGRRRPRPPGIEARRADCRRRNPVHARGVRALPAARGPRRVAARSNATGRADAVAEGGGPGRAASSASGAALSAGGGGPRGWWAAEGDDRRIHAVALSAIHEPAAHHRRSTGAATRTGTRSESQLGRPGAL